MELLDLIPRNGRIRASRPPRKEASIGGFAVLGQEIDPRAKIRGALHASSGRKPWRPACGHLERSDLAYEQSPRPDNRWPGRTMRRMMAELFGRCDGTNHGKRFDAHRRLLGWHAGRERHRGVRVYDCVRRPRR
jgi:pyruvate dehydrogenase E1 component alpha subunit